MHLLRKVFFFRLRSSWDVVHSYLVSLNTFLGIVVAPKGGKPAKPKKLSPEEIAAQEEAKRQKERELQALRIRALTPEKFAMLELGKELDATIRQLPTNTLALAPKV